MPAKALMIIDMLNDFARPGGSLYCGDSVQKIIPVIKDEIKKVRKEGGAILYVCDYHRPDDPEFKMFPSHAVGGTDGAKIIDELAPEGGEFVIPKVTLSGFFEGPINLILKQIGVKELTITGVCTNICVLYAVVDAKNSGYKVKVLKDAVTSFDEKAHEFALKEIKNTLGAEVI